MYTKPRCMTTAATYQQEVGHTDILHWRAKVCICQLSNLIKIHNFAPNCHIYTIFFFKSTNSKVLYLSTTFSLSSEVFFLLKWPLRVPYLLIDFLKRDIVSVDDNQIIFFYTFQTQIVYLCCVLKIGKYSLPTNKFQNLLR